MPIARTQQAELLDVPASHVSPEVLAGNLRDIRRANRWFGGKRIVLSALHPLLREHAGPTPLSILDLATGSADIPLAIAERAERERVPVRIVATDVHADIVAVARETDRQDSIVIETADARSLPYPDGSFDVVTLSLALHHFEPEDAVRVLREMARVGRTALIVNDLERSRLGFAGAWLVGNLLTTNPMTRNDAPLSVRRAYTRREALALAHAAGWHGAHVKGVLPFRILLTGRPA